MICAKIATLDAGLTVRRDGDALSNVISIRGIYADHQDDIFESHWRSASGFE